ncbi:ChbG/HpnK family deacetylase [Shinella sp. CPCC 101442]|uniref:ChbG/HpnK family deacetylase n=1 Tax=Shinella sp. CPCC 101442 TaxID=2932265 RepID=UPI00215337EF|nr:ChbG/HpnK family deacetylase [Shinella sp. CPCC 101442]MCR6501400.1 ChbG/HpnK family deacetylase [Shinella sp. CPCC 101442]
MLIADDFGLGREHDKVILDLIEHHRLDGTSVMIDGDIAAADMDRLRLLRSRGARVGLHLNVTHDFSEKANHRSVGRLLLACFSGNLPDDIRGEFQRQAEKFQASFGFLPDYYDGHQHCHCLPGLDALAARLPHDAKTWIRVPLPATFAGLVLNLRAGGQKVLLIAALAALARRTFRKAGWATNRDFSGFLRLDRPDQVARWLTRLLAAAPTDGVTMVHPGSATDPVQCPGHVAESRRIEASILSSM